MSIITTKLEENTHSILYEDYDDEAETRTLRRVYKGATPEERRAALEQKLKLAAVELRNANANWVTMTDAEKLRSLRTLYRGYVTLVQYLLFSMDDDEGI